MTYGYLCDLASAFFFGVSAGAAIVLAIWRKCAPNDKSPRE